MTEERFAFFRGMSEDTVAAQLMLRGWPEEAARKTAAWLCDRHSQPPRWQELTGQAR